MKKHALVILSVLALVSSCASKGKVIPPDDLTQIYADMFLADQWMLQSYSVKAKADTTLFYEAIFRKYGYTTQDYTASVHYYLEKPELYSKIVKRSAISLEKYRKRLQAVDDAVKNQVRVLQYIPKDFSADTILTLKYGQTDTLEVLQSHGSDHASLKRHHLQRVGLGAKGLLPEQ